VRQVQVLEASIKFGKLIQTFISKFGRDMAPSTIDSAMTVATQLTSFMGKNIVGKLKKLKK